MCVENRCTGPGITVYSVTWHSNIWVFNHFTMHLNTLFPGNLSVGKKSAKLHICNNLFCHKYLGQSVKLFRSSIQSTMNISKGCSLQKFQDTALEHGKLWYFYEKGHIPKLILTRAAPRGSRTSSPGACTSSWWFCRGPLIRWDLWKLCYKLHNTEIAFWNKRFPTSAKVVMYVYESGHLRLNAMYTDIKKISNQNIQLVLFSVGTIICP